MAGPPQFGERVFAVDKSPSDKDTLTNCAIVSLKVLPGIKHIVLRNTAGLERYFSVREKHGVKEDSIGLGKKQREWAGVQIADKVIVRPYDDTNNLGSITVELNFLDAGPKKAPAPFDTERMHSDFKVKDFPNQVFAKNQPFFYQTEGKPILLARVTGLEVLDPSVLKAKKPSSQSVAQDHGVLGLKTEVFFERAKGAPASLQLTGHHIGASGRVSLISPDWDFSKMGIGGLHQEFTDIFRRAFASRVFPPHIVKQMGVWHVAESFLAVHLMGGGAKVVV